MMILNLMPWVALAIGLAGVIIIIFRKMPVLLKLPPKPENADAPSIFARIKLRVKSLKYSGYQPILSTWVEKILRRLRLIILKIDNFFLVSIHKAREKSQVWTIRSRAWMEQHRLRKIEKLKILEKLDKAEVLETIQKAKEEVKEQEKNQGSTEPSLSLSAEESEEKQLIDLIAKNPRDIDSYRRLGFLYCKQGNKEDAKNCFRQVLKLEPGDLEVISKMKELK